MSTVVSGKYILTPNITNFVVENAYNSFNTTPRFTESLHANLITLCNCKISMPTSTFKDLINVAYYKDLTVDYLNIDFIHYIECLIASLTSDPDADFSYNPIIKQHITNIKFLDRSLKSRYGYLLVADLKIRDITLSELFVIKSHVNYTVTDNLEHEAFVCLRGTNQLRESIPNFLYCYGALSCSPVIPDVIANKVLGWCSTNKQSVSYLLFENCQNSNSLQYYLHNDLLSQEEFIQIYLQIIHSLKVALNTINFTHYCLTDRSIILRESDSNSYIKYDTNISSSVSSSTSSSTYIKINKYIPIITNFDNANVRVEGSNYGGRDCSERYGVYLKENPMHDIYKLLLACSYTTKKTSPIRPILENLFKFFNRSDSLDSVLLIQSKYEYNICKLIPPEYLDYHIEYAINYFKGLGTCDLLSSDNDLTSIDILKMKTLDTLDTLDTEEGIDGSEGIRSTISSYFDFIKHYSSYKSLQSIDKFKTFDYVGVYSMEKKKLLKKFESLEECRSGFVYMRVPNIQMLNSSTALKQMQLTYNKCSIFFDDYLYIYQLLESIRRVLHFVYKLDDTNETFAETTKLYGRLIEFEDIYNAIKKNIEIDVAKVLKYKETIELTGVYLWYYDVFPTIITLI